MSSEKLYYLRDEVYFEPLFNSWYAWPYLLAPAQSSRYTVATHLRLMKSFVKNYKLHIAASKQLAGGEFLYCKEEDVAEIGSLIDTTETNHRNLIELSQAVAELNDILKQHKSGTSIEPLYKKIPKLLRGYVELFMDLNHYPSYRILESLIYESEFYKEELQSVSFGISTRIEERPFILSTPRLADQNHLQLDLNFNSATLKAVLATRDTPLPMHHIEELLVGCKSKGGLDYHELFSSTKPQNRQKSPTESLIITYTGHAGFLLEAGEMTILIDPVIACLDERNPQKMTTYSDLPEQIDYICLTHSHQDHTQLETLLQLRHKTNKVLVPKNNGGSLADPSLKLMLKKLEFDVLEFEDMETLDFISGSITSIPFLGEHGDLNIRSKTAWLIKIAGKKLFFGADSSCLDEAMYSNIHNITGDVDLLAIGMECVGAPYTWLYGALYTEKVEKQIKESRRLNGANGQQALSMVNIFKPKQAYIYALGFETCYKYFMGIEYDEDSKQIKESNIMIAACNDLGIPTKKLIGSQEIILE